MYGTCVNVVTFHRRPSLGFVRVQCRVKLRLYKVIGTQPCPLLCLAQTAQSRWWLAFACRRKLNREVCQSASRLMEHLTQRRSRFELSHTLMTQPGACHHGCYTTQVNTFTQAVPFFWTRKTFHRQKMYLITLQKQSWHLSLTQFVSFIFFLSLFCPTKARARTHKHAHSWQLVFGHFIHHKLLCVSFTSVCLHDAVCIHDIMEVMVHLLAFWSQTRVILAQMTDCLASHISHVLGHFSMQR